MEWSVAQIGDELYALAPQAFTAARDTYVAQARNDGAPGVARELAALKRPTVVGFLVNVVALHHADAVDQFLGLAEQTDLPPRELAAHRRREIDGLLRLASTLAARAGAPEPNRSQLAEVESTFSAALVDSGVADLVRSGRVLKGFSYGGFGTLAGGESGFGVASAGSGTRNTSSGRSTGGAGADGSSTGSRAGGASAAGTASGAAADRGGSSGAGAASGAEARADRDAAAAAQAEAARAARTAAEARLEAAQQALADARSVEAAHATEIDRLTAEIAERKEQLDELTMAARSARQTRLAAERDLASAERRLARVT